MIVFIYFWSAIKLLFLTQALFNKCLMGWSVDLKDYTPKPYIFVSECLQENPKLLPTEYVPYVAISRCHLKENGNLCDKRYEERATLKAMSISHFSHHSFTIIFEENISTKEQACSFQFIYERLVISPPQWILFDYIGTNYREFNQYDPFWVKMDFLRSRWNFDEFILQGSRGAAELLKYGDQLPTSLQKLDERYKTNNVSDMALIYYVTSGYGQKCVHDSRYIKLQSLTFDFTAYDRLFCDAYEYHGLQHSIKDYWNLGDMYVEFHRSKLVRDGLMSYFPPDYANALYYASPKLTFVVIERYPITWLFVIRPFNKSLWIFLVITFTAMELIRNLNKFIDFCHFAHLKRKMIQRKLFAVIINPNLEERLDQVGNRYLNTLAIFNGILRIMLASAYSGMILVGILHPLYPWTPATFEDLNRTKNYYVGVAISSPFFITAHLTNRFKINMMEKEMIKERQLETPAEYLQFSVSSDFTGQEENQDKFYAAIMYDDKMNMWTKGRFCIWRTASFLDRIKPAEDKVLPEIRYVSIAPGATRLHFLMVTLKRAFTSGTWIRWYYLEQNYYTNVAPILAKTKLREMGMKQPKDARNKPRPLYIQDLFALLAMKGVALGFAFFTCMFELYTTCSYSQKI